jgi:hypothetical protein
MASLISRRGFLGMTAITVASAAATGTVHGRPTSPALGSVVRVAVHPAVGIARVGNSPDAFFFAPEVPGAVTTARAMLSAKSLRAMQKFLGLSRQGMRKQLGTELTHHSISHKPRPPNFVTRPSQTVPASQFSLALFRFGVPALLHSN